VSAGYRKRLTAGPAVATRPKPALAASRDWRRVGTGSPIRFRGRVRRKAFCPFRPPGAKRQKRLLFGPRSQKGPVDCVHQCRRLLLSSQERPSLQAPLRRHHLTLRHRRLTRSRRDRSRYPGEMSRWSATRPQPQGVGIHVRRSVPLTTAARSIAATVPRAGVWTLAGWGTDNVDQSCCRAGRKRQY
jgi:hypothetical protein